LKAKKEKRLGSWACGRWRIEFEIGGSKVRKAGFRIQNTGVKIDAACFLRTTVVFSIQIYHMDG
jgi:hypothetical protein